MAKKVKRGFAPVLIILSLVALYFGYAIFAANNINSDRDSYYAYIPSDATYDTVVKMLRDKSMLRDERSFGIVARLKGYDKAIKPGRFVFSKSMNNREIVNMLISGMQSKVKLNLYNIQTKADFAGIIGRTLELDSVSILDSLYSESFCLQYGCDPENILTHFIYNDYEFYWNATAEAIFEEFDMAYHEFWDKQRKSKAEVFNLSPIEATILASIVEKECMKEKEITRIAGVYLNRLRIGMPLQADPTLKFAAADFDARRVTNYHKEIESPYNTYKNRGLPPGPICIPRKKSIEAVLDAEAHSYLYFCASPDMSGYSVFSKTLSEQNKVAALYRKKLDLMNIRR